MHHLNSGWPGEHTRTKLVCSATSTECWSLKPSSVIEFGRRRYRLYLQMNISFCRNTEYIQSIQILIKCLIFSYEKSVCNCSFYAPNCLHVRVFNNVHNVGFKNTPCDYIKCSQYCMTKILKGSKQYLPNLGGMYCI